jgi:signal transduction histidine kinase
MTEAQTLGAKPFPTYQAERLAAQFLESDQPRVVGMGLQPTNLRNVWKLGSPDGRIIALLRSESVIAATGLVLNSAAHEGVVFSAAPPGTAASDGAVAAGPMLPGWQLFFSGLDSRRADSESVRRRNTYLWTGYLVIASMVLIGLLLGRSMRKQMQLARLKTDMVAAVTHELKTPLASMRLLVDALLDDERLEPVKTREYLHLISGENERLTRLVENFLTFSRIERRKQKFEFRAAEPGRIVDAAVAAVRERFQQSCVLEVDVEQDLPMVQADPNALATVLVNLLENAYKYTPGDKRLLVRGYRDAERVVFAVADNGIGIPVREHKRIFRKFYQVDQALARESGGCGLGLSIVDHIVRAHGGQVVVASMPGEGSTFSVMVPALSPAKGAL